MILIIHTLDQAAIHLTLGHLNGKVMSTLHKVVKGRQTEMVTPAIDQLLKRSKVKLTDLIGIIVASGPGGFTAVRSGVVVGNALGFALGIPVVGVEGEFANVDDMLVSDRCSLALKQLVRGPKFAQAKPAYGAQPNISKAKPKKFQQHTLKV